MLTVDGNLRCLTDGSGLRSSKTPGLPSYCLDLRFASTCRPLKMYSKCHAAGSEALLVQFEKLVLLHVNGWQVDAIQIKYSSPLGEENMDSLLYEWHALVSEYQEVREMMQGGVEIIWRTLIADTA
jgi:hypothetical protein